VGGFELSRLVSAALALLIASAPAFAGSAANPDALTARNEVVSSTQAAANQKATAYAQSLLDRLGIGRSAAGFIYGAFFVSGRKSKIKPAEKK